MNWLAKIHVSVMLLLLTSLSVYADLPSMIEQQLRPAKPLFTGIVAEKERILEERKQQRAEELRKKPEFDVRLNLRLEELRTLLPQVKEALNQNPDDAFLRQQAELLNETFQAVKDMRHTYETYLSVLTDCIKVLTEYVEDPGLLGYQKEKLPEKFYYQFEDLQKLYDATVDQQKQIEQLTDQKRNSIAEIENSKRTLAVAEDIYRARKDELELANKSAQQVFRGKRYESAQVIELLSLEQRLYEYKLELAELRIQLAKMYEELVSARLLVAEGRLKVLNDHIRKVKHSVRITDADIDGAREEFNKHRQYYFLVKETQSKELEHISELRKKKEKELDMLSAQYSIPLGSDIDDWTRELQQSAVWYAHYCRIGLLDTQVVLLRKGQELIEAQVALEDEKLKYESLLVHAKETYHKILFNKFLTEDEINNEIKTYEASKVDARTIFSRYKEQVLLIPDLLNSKKKTAENIARVRQIILKQKDTVFAGRQGDYMQALEALDAAETKIHEYVGILGKLTGVYSEISGNATSILHIIDFISGELKSITFWYRPDYAISWHDVTNIPADIAAFFSYVRSSMTRMSPAWMWGKIVAVSRQPIELIVWLLGLLTLAGCLLILVRCGHGLRSLLMQRMKSTAGFAHAMSVLFFGLLSFILMHASGIIAWILLFCALKPHGLLEPAFYIFFYLTSIPYFLYLAYRFIKFFAQYNEQHQYMFLAEDFQERFFTVLSTFLYASIVIVFFREAFMLVNFHGSALPTILLAVHFIIFQIALILLISKEQILHLISSRNPFWLWVKDRIEMYYYHVQVLIITIIIMINPYVGYGRLVLYSFFGLIYTGLLIMVLTWFYGFFKRLTSRVFFMTDDEVVRERFKNAKMWFGLFIITSFLLLLFLGVLIAAEIWGRPITYHEIYWWLTKPITPGSHGISLMSLFSIGAFTLGGLLLSHAFTYYVLDKIFDLLLVDSGVQHTIISISGYVFFIGSFFLGLHYVGLGDLVGWAFAVLAVSLGWMLKEPISDFIAYFIILVQRPIKIGDYVRLENDIMGVVRRISVRSVVLRRRNSTTIIVPNSYVIGHVVTNWNYVRGFIAFEDIMITIDYREDPVLVRDLLASVVEAHPSILRTPRPIIRLENFGEYGYYFLVRGFMSSSYTLDQWDIASDLRLNIARVLRERNIKIAVPVRMILGKDALPPPSSQSQS